MQKDCSVFIISQANWWNLGQFRNTTSCIYNLKLIMQTFATVKRSAYFIIYQTSNIGAFFTHRAALFHHGVLLLPNVLFTEYSFSSFYFMESDHWGGWILLPTGILTTYAEVIFKDKRLRHCLAMCQSSMTFKSEKHFLIWSESDITICHS